MPSAIVKNWAQFQHYKDRAPPWVKLHRSLLDDFDYARLPLASKALAPLLWLLAAENMDGSVNLDTQWLAFRLRWPEKDVEAGLKPLIVAGFLVSDSSALAERYQDATPETEGETEESRERTHRSKPVKQEKKRPMPAGFCVSENVKAWAAEKGHHRLDDHLESFRTKCQAKGYQYANWDAAFMGAIRDNWANLPAGSNGASPGGGRKAL